jgi:hypothetical protein
MCRRTLFGAPVPVTAKLSKLFYDRFGDQIVDELVDWFNAVDASYTANLRELNEANFARFEAKLNQRFAEQDAKFEKRFTELDTKVDRVAAELREFLERSLKDHTRWMFVAWASLLIPIIGLWMRP